MANNDKETLMLVEIFQYCLATEDNFHIDRILTFSPPRVSCLLASYHRCGDLVMTLRDGSKLEIRSLPEFERNYNYILERTPPV